MCLVPIQDALRTSMLSRRWRYCWKSMPKLVFDDKLVKFIPSESIPFRKYKLVNAIFHVLLLHTGPLSELSICIDDIDISNEIDQIILHLLRTNNIKTFIFKTCPNNRLPYKIPCSFFSLQGLQHVDLSYCEITFPVIVYGFNMLKTLSFFNVKIDTKVLQQFLTNCPLLEYFVLIGVQKDFTTIRSKCTFVELFKSLPSVKVVSISRFYIKHLTEASMPHELPTSLVNLRILVLDICFLRKGELLLTLCVINSSPNLEKIQMKMNDTSVPTFTNLLDLQEYSGINLDHLKELEMIGFHSYAPEMEFVKLIMANSPVLRKSRIELDASVSVDEENKMLRDFLLLPFPRASPSAKFSIERPQN